MQKEKTKKKKKKSYLNVVTSEAKKRNEKINCCDVVVAQINYPSLKHNTQDNIEQARGRSHEKGSSQIFMLNDMQFGGVWTLSILKQKKIENYQAKLNKIRKLSREQTLVTSKRPPTKIRTDHGNETSIYILNIYLFFTLVSIRICNITNPNHQTTTVSAQVI